VKRLASALLVLASAGASACAVGCRGQTSEDPPILLERNMYDSERYNPESYSSFFPDHRTMRTPVEGTIARDRYEDDPETATGLLADKSAYVMTIPQSIVQRAGGLERMLDRGHQRFGIYCAPCHGQTGDGKGMVVCKREAAGAPCESRGFPPVPSYETPRVRITHGARTMPAYGPQIPIADRWAIVSYVRALQLSQMAEAKPSEPEPKK
jgi:mono/diheme cytochrome c family protein